MFDIFDGPSSIAIRRRNVLSTGDRSFSAGSITSRPTRRRASAAPCATSSLEMARRPRLPATSGSRRGGGFGALHVRSGSVACDHPLCQGILTNMSVLVVAESLPVDPLEALRVLADSELELSRLRRERVVAARAAGASWQQVGDALGISRQSAWENFTADARGALAANVAANSSLGEDDAADLAVSEVRVVRRRRRSS